jgi:hypothetical protein
MVQLVKHPKSSEVTEGDLLEIPSLIDCDSGGIFMVHRDDLGDLCINYQTELIYIMSFRDRKNDSGRLLGVNKLTF